jgi:tetratricopeptide (TPR) repeat protein
MVIADAVTDIGSLWKLVAALIAAFCVIYFRKEIQAILKRGFKVKRGQTEFESLHKPGESASRPPGEGEEAAEEDSGSNEDQALVAAAQAAGEEVADNDEPTMVNVLIALMEKHKPEAEKEFQRVQANEADSVQRRENEVFFAGAKFEFLGDTEARAELERLAEEPATASMGHRVLGFALMRIGYPDQALAKFEEAEQTATDERTRVAAVVGATESLEKLGRHDAATEKIQTTLLEVESPNNIRSLYVALADRYLASDEWVLRALALEKALETTPNDVSLHFKAGYAYGEAGAYDLSLIHNSAAVETDADYVAARNNRGVAYEQLGMPIRSVADYEKAAAAGNTLAAANVAQRYMHAGFAQRAREALGKAAQAEDPHPNVAAATARIPELVEREDDLATKAGDRGAEKQRFFRDYAEARFRNEALPPDVEGGWTSGTAPGVTVEIAGERAVIEWQVGTTGHRAVGVLRGRSFIYDEEVEEYDFAKHEKVYKKKRTGFGTFGRAGHELALLTNEDFSESTVVRFHRAPSNPAET